jgi:hypothetical protein
MQSAEADLYESFEPTWGRGEGLSIHLLERLLEERGYSPRQRFPIDAPFVAVVADPGGRVIGRFFPSRNAILVVGSSDPVITRARLNHEFAHLLRYEKACKSPSGRAEHRSKCSYKGQHDRGFYRELEALHRYSGVPADVAVSLERGARYRYPKSWDRARW